MRLVWSSCLACIVAGSVVPRAAAQPAPTVLTWTAVRDRFRATNPSLDAGRIGIDEARAGEVTAYLRPNPQCAVTLDQIGNTVSTPVNPANAFSASNLTGNCSYLHERENKRELRRDSAVAGTTIAVSSQADLDRQLLFALRGAFVQVLQAKAALALARDNLTSYDSVLALGRDRLQAGDIARVDLDRLELQRVGFESDLEAATVNLRTAKVQLLRLLDDQTTPIEQFDVDGPFEFAALPQSLGELRRIALDTRPDLRAAMQGIDKAKLDHQLAVANGSADPAFAVDAGFPALSQVYLSYQPPLRQYFGIGVSIPLRISDKNQGEKARTLLDVTRNERLAEAARIQVIADVDTAYATAASAVALLQPYRDRYLGQATRVRDTVTFSYQRGALSLVDFLQAAQEYRTVQTAYVNLVAAYLNAINQLNFAVGREVLP